MFLAALLACATTSAPDSDTAPDRPALTGKSSGLREITPTCADGAATWTADDAPAIVRVWVCDSDNCEAPPVTLEWRAPSTARAYPVDCDFTIRVQVIE